MSLIALRGLGAAAHKGDYVASRAAIGETPHGNLFARCRMGNRVPVPGDLAPRVADSGDVGDGEHVLPMRYRREHACFHPITVRQHPLLMAARAEVPRLARKGEAAGVPALAAVNPGEAVLRVARLKLGRMPGGAFIQRRRARIARPVRPGSGHLRCMHASCMHRATQYCRRADYIEHCRCRAAL